MRTAIPIAAPPAAVDAEPLPARAAPTVARAGALGNRTLARQLAPAGNGTSRFRPTALPTYPVLARSPESDRLRELLRTGPREEIFNRLRALRRPDPDVQAFVDGELAGDERWLGQTILAHGREARWPIELLVEFELKRLPGARGVAGVHERLRASNGRHARNATLTATVGRLLSGEDLWLAQMLQTHGREARWPIQVRVERELRSGGGGVPAVLGLLRAQNGRAARNAQLTALLTARLTGDDLWKAQMLQAHGTEARWPFHVTLEGEFHGGGGAAAALGRLRTANGAHAGNRRAREVVARVFSGDELWLAERLLRHGREDRWPPEERVDHAINHGGGGVAAVLAFLRTAGGRHRGNARLKTAIDTHVPAGDDRTLAHNLRLYGAEAAWPRPAEIYQTPFSNSPKSSAGERVIFSGTYRFGSHRDVPHFHELTYTAVGGAFGSHGGGASVTVREPGRHANEVEATNLFFDIGAGWNGTDPVTVTFNMRIRGTGTVVRTRTWTFAGRSTAPTTMTQRETEGRRDHSSGSAVYHYTMGPNINGPGRPDYAGQTILETFSPRATNIQPADLTPAARAAHGGSSAAIAAHYFGGSGHNGTFVVDRSDQIADQHGGGHEGMDRLAADLHTPKEIHQDLPQEYSAGPGNVIGRYLVRRIRTARGGYKISKARTGP